MHDGVVTFILMVSFMVYCIPMCVAMLRNHRQMLAIIVLNFLLGWTLIGWVWSLVWACTNPAPVIVMTAKD